jgi:lipoprotein NlpI
MADYDQAIWLSPTLAEAIRNRGLLHLKLGAIDKAIADFGTAIRLRLDNATLLTDRATAFVLIGKYVEAFADFDRALQIDPGNAAAYLGRGRSRLFAGDVAASIDDFITALHLRPENPNPVVWLHIARVHSGADDRRELEQNAARVAEAVWPKALLDLYLGKLDADSVRSAAAEGPPKDRARRTCEAEFYLAEFAVHSGELSTGRRLLEEVSSRCRQYSALYSAAQAELRFATQ